MSKSQSGLPGDDQAHPSGGGGGEESRGDAGQSQTGRPTGSTASGIQPPPAHIIELAVGVSTHSPCQSKRGAVIFKGDDIIAHGFNYKPSAFACDGSDACKATCREEAIHAEQQALFVAGHDAQGSEMLHVKTINGRLVPSGGPSCVQCSKLSLVAGVERFWLYEECGWVRYKMDLFHQLSISAGLPSAGESKALTASDVPRAENREHPTSLPVASGSSTVRQVAKAARAKAEVLRTDPGWRKRFRHANEQAFALDHFASDLEAGLWADWLSPQPLIDRGRRK